MALITLLGLAGQAVSFVLRGFGIAALAEGLAACAMAAVWLAWVLLRALGWSRGDKPRGRAPGTVRRETGW